MGQAETVKHLHQAMTWDFRVIGIILAILMLIVIWILLADKIGK